MLSVAGILRSVLFMSNSNYTKLESKFRSQAELNYEFVRIANLRRCFEMLASCIVAFIATVNINHIMPCTHAIIICGLFYRNPRIVGYLFAGFWLGLLTKTNLNVIHSFNINLIECLPAVISGIWYKRFVNNDIAPLETKKGFFGLFLISAFNSAITLLGLYLLFGAKTDVAGYLFGNFAITGLILGNVRRINIFKLTNLSFISIIIIISLF